MTPPRRLPDWQDRLAKYVASQFDEIGFVRSELDCLTFALGGIDAMTGSTLSAAWVGQYKSALSAARYARTMGLPNNANGTDIYFERMGFQKIEPSLALTGDVGLVAMLKEPSIVIKYRHTFITRGRVGRLVEAPAPDHAWHIPL